MFHWTKARRKQRQVDEEMREFGRRLRSFDIEAIAPYDHKGLVAFLKADKLSDLTTAQVRVFLLLRDTPDPKGLTTSYISSWLEMSPNTVRFCLAALKARGYATHSNVERRDERGRPVVAWVYDRSHWFADEDFLYWEFGELLG